MRRAFCYCVKYFVDNFGHQHAGCGPFFVPDVAQSQDVTSVCVGPLSPRATRDVSRK